MPRLNPSGILPNLPFSLGLESVFTKIVLSDLFSCSSGVFTG
ncbi:MAG: hypothetical protein QM751_00020 [Paludibacteraceae bacterium]